MFEHEISRPNNKAILYYLWQDYFHDSKIVDIKYEGYKIILKLECIRDEDEFYIKNKRNNKEIKELYNKEKEALKFQYKIIFNKYKYHNHEHVGGNGISYLYGRFKHSAILSKIEKTLKSPHYHFYIDTNGGSFEVICEQIIIKKVKGQIKIKYIMEEEWYIHWLKTYKDGILMNEYNDLNTDSIIKLVQTGVNLESYYSLVYLALRRDVNAIQLSRQIVNTNPEDWKETIEPAIWVLGELGDKSDLELLQKLYLESIHVEYDFPCSDIGERRVIIDSIEKLYKRINSK